jgi:adenylyl cyclase-associated protein
MEDLVKRLEVATARLEKLAGSGQSISTSTAPSVIQGSTGGGATLTEYDSNVEPAVQDFFKASQTIGGLVAQQALQVQGAFQACKSLIATATQSQKPSMNDLQTLVKPLQEAIQSVQEIKNANRTNPHFNHLSAVAEGIPCLGWVMVEPTPAPFILEMRDSAQFYSNRVLKEFKDKDQAHVDWVNSWIQVFVALAAYVKKWHTTGLVWSGKVANGAVAE